MHRCRVGAAAAIAIALGTALFAISACGTRTGSSATSTAPCGQRTFLRFSYRAGGLATGTDFGVVLFRDVTVSSCRLAGRVQITGVNPTGRPATNILTAAIASPGVLSPDKQTVRDLAPVPLGVLTWLLQAPYRDDPTSPDGLCTAHYVIPVRWRARLPDGSIVMVPNADNGSLARVSSSGGLVTCRGRLGAVSQVTLGGG